MHVGGACITGSIKYWVRGHEIESKFTGRELRLESLWDNNFTTEVKIKVDLDSEDKNSVVHILS